MLGNQAIKQYFATGQSHYILPTVSIEWNYNLFHSPYMTTNGVGTIFNPSNSWTDISKWSTAPTKLPAGKITSIFKADNSSTTRSCLGFTSSNGTGHSTIHIPTDASTKTYKIVFLAKVDRDVEVNLTALTYVDTHRSHSSSQLINSFEWTKFEVYVSSRPIDTQYSGFDFTLDYTSREENQNFIVLIDKIEMYESTDFEYQYGNLWPTSSPFSFFRPGESYIPSGNSLTQLPSDFRKVNNKFADKWNNQKFPCSPVNYHPKIIGANNQNPLFKNGIISEYSRYKYFVGEGSSSSISAIYDEMLYSNKIVLKFNLSYSKPSAFNVKLISAIEIGGTFTETLVANLSLTNSDISDAGVCIIYRQSDGTWKTSLAGGTWTTMPEFDTNGNITNSVGINKIVLTQSSSTVDSKYSTTVKRPDKTTSDVSEEMKKMQIIEISPRLEIDVSKFTMSINTTVELDNKQNPLPISAISSNSATVELSNVPLKVSNEVLSLFSNNSSTSPLKGLFKKNVKFYLNYVIKDSVGGIGASQAVIPGGVYYADTWDGQDIQRTQVKLYDITKYLQMLPPIDYVSQSENVAMIISNILDFAGFTDYDYDQLLFVTSAKKTNTDGSISKNSAPIQMQYFYCDSSQQKVFDVLREIFEVYQIGAYIDSYGVMKFINIDNIFEKTAFDMILHDSKTPIVITSPAYSNSLTVSSNIIQDTYTESVKTKVGKATFRFKTPQLSKTISEDKRLLNNDLYVNYDATYVQSENVIWSIALENEVATYNTLGESIKSVSQNYFVIDQKEMNESNTNNFRQFGINHDGFAIIEGEIVSFKDKEVEFTINTVDSTGAVKSSKSDKRIVSNESDLSAAKAEVFGTLGLNGSASSHMTGRIMNVERGLFNTPVKTHTVMSSKDDILTRFDIKAGTGPTWDSSTKSISLPAAVDANILVAKDEVSHDYNTFSTKMLIGPGNGKTLANGLFGGLILYKKVGNTNVESCRIFIQQIARDTKNTNSTSDGYQLRVTDADNKSLFKSGIERYDIDHIITSDAALYQSPAPFEELSKVINLKFVKLNNKGQAFDVYINNHKINVQTESDTAPQTDGQFGIFSQSLSGAPTLNFTELYATQSPLDKEGLDYHYELPSFVEHIASNKKIFEVNCLIQTVPAIVGVNYYDVKLDHAPSMDAFPLKVKYDWWYLDDGQINVTTQTKKTPKAMTIDENSLSYSPIYHSGFRSRFAIVNSSPSQVWIKKTTPDGNNLATVDFSLVTNSLVSQGNEVVIEKIFDPSNILETVDIASNWVQSKNTAMAILRNVYRCLDGFSRDTTISIYGNPLFEIGDIVHIQYNLKNIGTGEAIPNKYFVQGITQTFNTGLQTVLTLNQIA